MLTQKKRIYFENLDGLRFLCFLSVFLFHSFHTEIDAIKSNYWYSFIATDIFGNGNLGVNFFFVLSGFLITYLLIQEKQLKGNIHLKNFWIRRILRIWPLFYSCVIFGFYIFPQLKTLFGQTPNETANIIYYLTFLNNFDFIDNGLPDASILGVLWSVAIEEQFYLIWPIILYIIPLRKYWIPFTTIIIGSLVFRFFNDIPLLHEHHTLSCIGDMTVGAMGAWLIIYKNNFRTKIENISKPLLFVLYFITILIFLFRDEIIELNSMIRIFERTAIAVIMLLIILEQNFCKNSLFKMSNFKRISKLGQITYGLYCLHFIGILITITLTNKLNFNTQLWQVVFLETSIALIITIVISKISFLILETPFLKLKDKFAFIVKK